MRLYFPFNTQLARTLTSVSLMILLVACEGNTSQGKANPTPTPRPTPIATASTTSNSTLVPQLNTTGEQTIDMDGLSIYSANGFQCPLGITHVFPSDNLVLATDRLTYDIGAIQEMQTYIAKAVFDKQSYLTQPPATLQWVPGNSCSIDLQITNTGDTVVQIVKAGVKLQHDSRPNNYQYHLVDACSFTTDCQVFPAILSPCSSFIQLQSGSAGTLFENTFANPYSFNGQGQCPELTLKPKGVAEVQIDFSASSAAGIFSVVPQLTLVTATGRSALPLPQLAGTVAFANHSQFSCYSLRGDTLVQVNLNPARGVNCI